MDDSISFIKPIKNNKKKPEKSILKELQKYELPQHITVKADVIYTKMRHQVRRGGIRIKQLFICTYYAYIELNETVEPYTLGMNVFKLTRNEIQISYNIFSPLQTGYYPPSVITSCKDYIAIFCKKMNISDNSLERINNMSDIFIQKDPSLAEESPQTLAAGILHYYMLTNGIVTENNNEIITVTSRSFVTIQSISKKISLIDNKEDEKE